MTVEFKGKNYPLLRANKKGEVLCPFCKKIHTHGKISGHRLAHCSGIFYSPIHIDGFQFYQSDGYCVEYNFNGLGL